MITITHSCSEGMELAVFQAWLAFQLLDKVAMPVQALIKALQRSLPGNYRKRLAT